MASHMGGQGPLIDTDIPLQPLPEGYKLNKEQFQLVDSLLLSYLQDCNLYVSPEETRKKESILRNLELIISDWVYETYKDVFLANMQFYRKQPNLPRSERLVRLYPFGSYYLGINEPSSDVDTVVIFPQYVRIVDFFDKFPTIISQMPQVSYFDCIRDAKVPLITLTYDGVDFDLSTAVMAINRVTDAIPFLDPECTSNMHEKSILSLNGYRTNIHVKSQFAGNTLFYSTFQNAVRALRLWCKRKYIYSNRCGFFGGINCIILVANVMLRSSFELLRSDAEQQNMEYRASLSDVPGDPAGANDSSDIQPPYIQYNSDSILELRECVPLTLWLYNIYYYYSRLDWSTKAVQLPNPVHASSATRLSMTSQSWTRRDKDKMCLLTAVEPYFNSTDKIFETTFDVILTNFRQGVKAILDIVRGVSAAYSFGIDIARPLLRPALWDTFLYDNSLEFFSNPGYRPNVMYLLVTRNTMSSTSMVELDKVKSFLESRINRICRRLLANLQPAVGNNARLIRVHPFPRWYDSTCLGEPENGKHYFYIGMETSTTGDLRGLSERLSLEIRNFARECKAYLSEKRMLLGMESIDKMLQIKIATYKDLPEALRRLSPPEHAKSLCPNAFN